MDKDRIGGAAKELKGAAKQVLGKMTGDQKLQVEGLHDKAEGKFQNTLGGIRDAVKDKAKK